MQHDAFPNDPALGSAIVFAQLVGLTCSICAPLIMGQEDVEAAAMLLVRPRKGPWQAVDKSKPPISIGSPTPNACNLYPDRQHWFLISE